mgnify:FL=1
MSVPKELPPDEVIVYEGSVVSLKEWCDWNGNHTLVLHARMESKEDFSVFPHDPEHGGTQFQSGKTMLEAAEKAMHPDIAKKLAALFDLKNPTEEQIRQHHYGKGGRLKVIFQ